MTTPGSCPLRSAVSLYLGKGKTRRISSRSPRSTLPGVFDGARAGAGGSQPPLPVRVGPLAEPLVALAPPPFAAAPPGVAPPAAAALVADVRVPAAVVALVPPSRPPVALAGPVVAVRVPDVEPGGRQRLGLRRALPELVVALPPLPVAAHVPVALVALGVVDRPVVGVGAKVVALVGRAALRLRRLEGLRPGHHLRQGQRRVVAALQLLGGLVVEVVPRVR